MFKKISTAAYYKNIDIKPEELNKIAEREFESNLPNMYPLLGGNIEDLNYMNEKAEIVKESIQSFFTKYKELKIIKKESKNSNSILPSKLASKRQSTIKTQSNLSLELKKSKSKKHKTAGVLIPKRTQSSIQLKNFMFLNNLINKRDKDAINTTSNNKLSRKRSISMKDLCVFKNEQFFQFNRNKVPLQFAENTSVDINNNNSENNQYFYQKEALQSGRSIFCINNNKNKSRKPTIPNANITVSNSDKDKSSFNLNNNNNNNYNISTKRNSIRIKHSSNYISLERINNQGIPNSNEKRYDSPQLNKEKEHLKIKNNNIEVSPTRISGMNSITEKRGRSFSLKDDDPSNRYNYGISTKFKNDSQNASQEEDLNEGSENESNKHKSLIFIDNPDNNNESKAIGDISHLSNSNFLINEEEGKTKGKRDNYKRKNTLNASNVNIEDKNKVELFKDNKSNPRTLYIIERVYDSLSDDETNLNFEDYDYLIHPESPFHAYLDFFFIIVIFLSTFSIPLNLTLEFQDKTYFKVIDILYDFFMLIFIFSMLFTPYLDDNLQLIFDKNLIRKKYFQGFFIVDFISFFPVNTILNFGVNLEDSFYQLLRLIRILKFFVLSNLNKRLVNKIFFVKYFKHKLISSTNKYGIIVQFFNFLLNFLVSIHISSCVFIYLAKMNPNSNWINNRGLQDTDFGTIYVASIYFHLVTIFTVGYGDIISKSEAEYIYNSMFLLVGIGVYSLTVSFLSKFSVDDPRSKAINTNIDYLKYLDRNFSLPKKLFSKALRLIRNDDEVIRKEKIALIEELPANLKQELIIQSHREVFENFKFFKNLGNKKEFISKVIQVMKPAIGYKSEILIEEDQIIEETIFVKQGVMCLDINYKKVTVSVLCIRRNEHFGDSLMMLHKPSPISARVKSKFIELYFLRKFDFIYILFDYPIIFDTIFENGTKNLMILEKNIEIKKNIIDNMYPTISSEKIKESNSISSFDYFTGNNNKNNDKDNNNGSNNNNNANSDNIYSDDNNKNLSIVLENPSENNFQAHTPKIIHSKRDITIHTNSNQNSKLNTVSNMHNLNTLSNKNIINSSNDNNLNISDNKPLESKFHLQNCNYLNKPTKKAKSLNNFEFNSPEFDEERNKDKFNKIFKGESLEDEDEVNLNKFTERKKSTIEKLAMFNKSDKNIGKIGNNISSLKTVKGKVDDKNSKKNSTNQSMKGANDASGFLNKTDLSNNQGKGKNKLMHQLNLNMENSTQLLLDSQNYFSEYFKTLMNKNNKNTNTNTNTNEMENRLDRLVHQLKKTISDKKQQ